MAERLQRMQQAGHVLAGLLFRHQRLQTLLEGIDLPSRAEPAQSIVEFAKLAQFLTLIQMTVGFCFFIGIH
ncbi:hypothetical protein DSL92_05330 [Billgrantia gudaonensis]|uniref:Uncharacterized protein n=1 Tax=Billgrantia gudaonensis TaxID=376427 RepID=A0A432JJ05_9GAMM|nr:hypothetical protein DSL92_05330 [Halomonas gudaonensis]